MNAIVQTINSAGRAFADFALPMLIQSGVLILIVLLVDLALRRRVRAVFRYWIWLLILLKLVLPPSLWSPLSVGTYLGETLESPALVLEEAIEAQAPEPVPAWQPPAKLADGVPESPIARSFALETLTPVVAPPAPPRPTVRTTPAPPAPVETTPSPATPVASEPAVSLNWPGLVLLIWLAIAVGLLLLLLQRALFVKGLVAQAEPASCRLRDALGECQERLGLNRVVALRVSPNATSPAVCGLLRPTILIPQNLAPKLSGNDLQAVLLHELAHIKRGDLWVNLIQTLLQIIYFYNPLLWLANAMIRRVREQAVDEAVLVAMGETAADYPETLVNIAKLAFKKRPVLSLRLIGVVESKSALSGRIRHILSRPFPKTAKLSLLGLSVVFLIAAVLLPMAKARPMTDRAREVMPQARQEARRLNHAYIGTEHILLALASNDEAVSARVFANLGVEVETLRTEVSKLLKAGGEPATKRGLPRTPRARKVFRYARQEARALGHDYLGTEHILLGLTEESNSIAAQVLTNLNLTPEQIRTEVLKLVQSEFERDTGYLVKFTKREQDGFRRTSVNGKSAWHWAYDVEFAPHEELVVIAELYRAGQPMRHLGHKVFHGTPEIQTLKGAFTKTYQNEAKTLVAHTGRVELAGQVFEIPELTLDTKRHFPGDGWASYQSDGLRRLRNHVTEKDYAELKLLFHYRSTDGRGPSDDKAYFWIPGDTVSPMSSHHAVVFKMIPASRLHHLVIDAVSGRQGLDGRIMPTDAPIEQVRKIEKNYKAEILNLVKSGSSDSDLRGSHAEKDTDGDGLSDFQERHKYLTDPEKRDSDGDGTPDGDWDERREYAYSVRTVFRFLPPLDEESLCDGFQDARVLNQTNEYIEIEAIHYPLATSHEAVGENRQWKRDYAHMTEYLAPGPTVNWDASMRRDLSAALRADGIDIDALTDKQVVEQVSRWLLKRSRYLGKVFTTFYVHGPDGEPRILPGLEDAYQGEFNRDKDNYDWTIDEHFDHEVLGKGMFYNRTHGSCTSTAIYLTTVLRALGIPTRMVFVSPAVDASNREQILMVRNGITNHRVRETMLAGLRRSSRGFTNHTLNEVYIGNRWVRLDYSTLSPSVFGVRHFGLQTHLYTVNDLCDIDLASTWGRRYAKSERSDTFKHSNPYSAVEVSDLFGVHSRIPNAPFQASDLASSPLPDIFVLHPGGVNIWNDVMALVKDRTFNKTGRPHKQEFYENIFEGVWTTKPGDVMLLAFSLDTQERIPEGYEFVLPQPWTQIESRLKQGQMVEMEGQARDMKVILLAAPAQAQLKPLVQNSQLLAALGGHPEPKKAEPSTPARADSASQYSVELANGVRVRLLGVCGHPSEGKQWWSPDGTPLETAPYHTTGGRMQDEEGYVPYEYAAQIQGARDLGIRWRVPGGNRGSDRGPALGQAGEYLTGTYAYTSNQPPEVESTNVFIGITSADWQTRAIHDTPDDEGSYTLDKDQAIAFGVAYEKDGQAHVPITSTIRSADMDSRLVAVDTSGQSHTGARSTSGGNVLSSTTCSFDMPLDRIREFRFQTRPYLWVEFRNVSLRPEQKTDLEVRFATTYDPDVADEVIFPDVDDEGGGGGAPVATSGVAAQLPNGVTAEFLAYSQLTSQGLKWWTPQGRPTTIPGLYEADVEGYGAVLAFRFDAELESFYIWSYQPPDKRTKLEKKWYLEDKGIWLVALDQPDSFVNIEMQAIIADPPVLAPVACDVQQAQSQIEINESGIRRISNLQAAGEDRLLLEAHLSVGGPRVVAALDKAGNPHSVRPAPSGGRDMLMEAYPQRALRLEADLPVDQFAGLLVEARATRGGRVKFRNISLDPDRATETRVEIVPGQQGPWWSRSERSEEFERLAKRLATDARLNNGRYPDDLADAIGDFDEAWVEQHVTYLGRGKTPTDEPPTVVALEKEVLAAGYGTYVIHSYNNVAFRTTAELQALGIVRMDSFDMRTQSPPERPAEVETPVRAPVTAKLPNGVTIELLAYSWLPPHDGLALSESGLAWYSPNGERTTIPGVYEADVEGLGTVLAVRVEPPEAELHAHLYRGPDTERIEKTWALPESNIRLLSLGQERRFANLRITTRVRMPAVVETIALNEKNVGQLVDVNRCGLAKIVDLQVLEGMGPGMMMEPYGLGMGMDTETIESMGLQDMTDPPTLRFTCINAPNSFPSLTALLDTEGETHPLEQHSTGRHSTYEGQLWPSQLAGLVVEASPVRAASVNLRNISLTPHHVTEVRVETDPEQELEWHLSDARQSMNGLTEALERYHSVFGDRFPTSLWGLESYFPKDFFAKLTARIAYRSEGRTPYDDPRTFIAYDKTLLPQNKGTYVLYSDNEYEFESPQELRELGILGPIQVEPKPEPEIPHVKNDAGIADLPAGFLQVVQRMHDARVRLPEPVQAIGKMLERWVSDIAQGDLSAARRAYAPGNPRGDSDSNDLKELLAFNPGWEFSLHSVAWHGEDAMALSGRLGAGDPKSDPGPVVLVWTLKRFENRWGITDIDLEEIEGLQREIFRFIMRHPGAQIWSPEPGPEIIHMQDPSKAPERAFMYTGNNTWRYGPLPTDTVKANTPGPLGERAVSFDGIDDCLVIPASPSLALKAPFSIELWIKPDFSNLPKNEPPYVNLVRKGAALESTGREQSKGYFTSARQSPKSPNSCQAGIYIASGRGKFAQTGLSLPDRLKLDHPGWSHLSLNITREDYIPAPDQPIIIGAFGTVARPSLKGQIAEVRIWNRLLTNAETTYYGSMSLEGNEPGLVGCWDFEHQSGGQIVCDISPNANHAHLGKRIDADSADPTWVGLESNSPPTPSEVSGRVVDPSGNPVVDAQVASSTAEIGVVVQDGLLQQPRTSDMEKGQILETDAQGRFRFESPPSGAFDILVAHKKGFALVSGEQFAQDGTIRLQPWGRVEGRLATGRQALAEKISMYALPNVTWLEHKRKYQYEALCDTDGRFTFERVPPGRFEVGYLVRTGSSGTSSLTSRTPVEVQAGQTTQMKLGGEGRPVIGRFVPPPGYDGPLYFGAGLRSLNTARPEEPRPENYDRMTKREQQAWRAQWRDTPEARAFYIAMWSNPKWRHYCFEIRKDGSFRIEDVIPGRYDLTVWLEERYAGQGRVEEIGHYNGTIEMPPMEEAASDEPLDLGELTLRMKNPLHVGDTAPQFEARTLNGKPIRLADYRGRFVLLNFWQPVSHPELDRLKELHADYGGTGRLQIIGLGGTDTLKEVKDVATEHKIAWPEIYFGEQWDQGIAKQYALPGLPYILLIDPTGKIVATWLRNEELTDTVREAIAKAEWGISGRVIDSDGAPVPGTQVALCTEEMGVTIGAKHLTPDMRAGKDSEIVETDADGRFAFSQTPKEFDLVAAHDRGFAWSVHSQASPALELRLNPWSRLEGTLIIDGKPGADRQMTLQNNVTVNTIERGVYHDYSTRTDSAGRFAFEGVRPGWIDVGYYGSKVSGSRQRSVRMRRIHLKPGEHTELVWNGEGRPVTGRFVPPADYVGNVYFQGRGFRYLSTSSPKRPRPDDYGQMTRAEQQEWDRQWNKTPEAGIYRDTVRHDPNRRLYAFAINEDGSFRIDDVLPGTYDMRIELRERPQLIPNPNATFPVQPFVAGRPAAVIAVHSGAVQVPSRAEADGDALFDLGELILEMRTPLSAEEAADESRPFAWERRDRYVAPDPEGFFPDDKEGGTHLDALFAAPDKDQRSDEEIFATVRAGFRRTTKHRTLILSWIGNRYVWGKSPQHPEAIEIMYHAVPMQRHYAVYFGLSVVRNKTPNILRTLAEICMQSEEVGRITWGLGDQRNEIVPYIERYADDDDPQKREIASVLLQHFAGTLDFEQWKEERRIERVRTEFGERLPRFRETLLTGASSARREVMETILRHRLGPLLDDSFLPAMKAAADDSDRKVRNEIARTTGGRWIWGAKEQHPEAIALMLKLARDEDREVRYNAVYYGLSVVRNKTEPVVRRLVELALADEENNFYGRITWGLKGSVRNGSEVFREVLAAESDRAGEDSVRLARIHKLRKDVLDEDAPTN